jgi:glycosyltransferase involved in cell wall biosynthesis
MAFGRLREALRGKAPPPPPEFDAAFYRETYADLAALRTPAALYSHYVAHGREEGRFQSRKDALSKLQAKWGKLPRDFDPAGYRSLHADLRGRTDPEVIEHYLRQGRQEKRRYFPFDPDLYAALYHPGEVVSDQELEAEFKRLGVSEGRIGTWAAYVESRGGEAGPWVDRLKRDEFELLNASWAGPVRTKLEAVTLFLDKGLLRLAPIAFDAQFDPTYYREVHPEAAALRDEALYRRWLFVDLPGGAAGSSAEHLKQLGFPASEYPAGFDWQAYAAASKLPLRRWPALEHLVRAGLKPAEALPAAGPGAAAFAAAVGLRWRGVADPSAAAAYETARDLGDRSYATAHHLGDALFRLGEWRKALSSFQEAATHSEAEVWTYVNGAKSALKLGAYRAAFDLLRLGRELVSGEPVWRQAVHEVAEAYFKARTNRARRLYALEGGRARADRLVERFIKRTAELWTDLDPIGAPLGGSPSGKIVILASFDLRVCTHYRVEQKEELFEALGRPYEVYRPDQWEDFIAALAGAAAAIFFRLAAWPTVTRAMNAARVMGVPTYYEIDDLIFDAEQYPDTLESYGGLLSAEEYEAIVFGVPLFRAAMQLCDYGIASTTPLVRAAEPLVRTGQVFWLPNGLDSRNQPYLEQLPDRVRRTDEVWIAYASGTKAHNTDWNELAGPALLSLMQAHPEVRLLLVGYLALDPAFDALRDRIMQFGYVPGAESFWSMLADADINLAVLKPTWATDSKSEIKWLEAAVMGVPSIVSDTATYLEVLEDGRDALIARNPEEWRRALERLVTEPELRRTLVQNARRKAREQYAVEANSKRLETLLQPALQQEPRRRRPADGRKRVLLSNVWFPPQSIGGATRVVRNNLDAWLDAGLDSEFEFAVATTDAGVSPPYRTRVDTYRGVPVVRFSTPMRVNMDWRPEDHQVRRLFAELLAQWEPDLVHFHAVQRLTVSAPQACQDAGVPYLITTHDAWWLSDWHFLVDDAGELHAPCEPLPRNPPTGVSVAQSLDRRRLLAAALDGAEAVLGVSDSFAEMHRRCGFEHTLAVPNGLPPMPAVARTPSASGRVRLAHVGNVSKHKGFHLVRAALTRGRFDRLELTVIDHARSIGSEERTTWGATPVRIIGKTAQEQMHRLYAETDVLLAPSIWPESYGLVAREALAAGCWVVASDLGAMGEDVTPGVNGFVVDVSNVEGVLGALAEINADPARFLQSPATIPPIRSADEQAAEVMALYRRVLGGEELFGERPKRRPFAGTVATDPERLEHRRTEFASRRAARRA